MIKYSSLLHKYTKDINKKNYWDKRASNSSLPGSNDSCLDFYETNFLIKFIKKRDKYILDAGCGNGLFLKNISKKKNYLKLVGFDYSSEMIRQAKKFKIKNTDFYQLNINKCLDLRKFVDRKFDLIFTKRSLINLNTKNDQLRAIENLSSLLKKDGRLICCESSQTSLDNINFFRKKISLKIISKPWHNLYLEDSLIINKKFKKLKLKCIYPFLSTWYFVSRVINASLAKKLKKNPSNNDFLSKMSYKLPQDMSPDFSQTKVFEFKKI